MNDVLKYFGELGKLLDPITIGYDDFFHRLHNAAGRHVTYPPYNIRKDGDDTTVEVALAGFSRNEIEVFVENSTLVILSNKSENEYNEDAESSLVYKGIAKRNFELRFALANEIVVDHADMHEGMLRVHLKRSVPDRKLIFIQ